MAIGDTLLPPVQVETGGEARASTGGDGVSVAGCGGAGAWALEEIEPLEEGDRTREFVECTVRDYALQFAQLFRRPLRQRRRAFRPSDADLLLWALFQGGARRGAVVQHVRHVAVEMR
jgi:hypothetical protein